MKVCARQRLLERRAHYLHIICPLLAHLPTCPLAPSPPRPLARSAASEWLPVRSLSQSHGHPAPTCQLS
jgi:hypothetical protein